MNSRDNKSRLNALNDTRQPNSMNSNKKLSSIDGRKFLRDALVLESELLAKSLQLSVHSITHNGLMGEVNEQHFIEVLRRYLPRRYAVSRGIVIDSTGETSDQIDIIIYDNQYTPRMLDQQAHSYVLAEAVYAVLEVKPQINRETVNYAAQKAQTVRKLLRTSNPIVHSDKNEATKPKIPFAILGGLVAIRSGWVNGLADNHFSDLLAECTGANTLSLGLALEDQAFNLEHPKNDLTLPHGELQFSGHACSLAWFLFTLLKRLQDLGTCPAVNWLRYRDVLSHISLT